MIKKFSFAVFLLACLAGCSSKTAYNYNEDFVKKESRLSPEIEMTENRVGRYMNYEQWDSIAVAGERMEGLIAEVVKEIKEKPAPDVKEGQNFKDAGVRYFEFMKSMYTAYKNFGREKTSEGRTAQLEKIKEISDNQRIEFDNIQSAQRKFASANGFNIQNKVIKPR